MKKSRRSKFQAAFACALGALACVLIAIAAHAYNLAVSLNRFALNVPVFATVGIVLSLIGCAAVWRRTSSIPRRAFAVAGITLVYAAVIYGNFAILHSSDATRIVVERNGQRRLLKDGWHCNLTDRLVVFAPAYISLEPDQRFTFERQSGGYFIRGELQDLRLVIPRDERRLLRASGVDNLTMRTSFEDVMKRIEDQAAAKAALLSCAPSASDFYVGFSLAVGHWTAQSSISHSPEVPCGEIALDWGDAPLDPMLTALGARVESARVTIISRTPLPHRRASSPPVASLTVREDIRNTP